VVKSLRVIATISPLRNASPGGEARIEAKFMRRGSHNDKSTMMIVFGDSRRRLRQSARSGQKTICHCGRVSLMPMHATRYAIHEYRQ
jgi:hypothetical protein